MSHKHPCTQILNILKNRGNGANLLYAEAQFEKNGGKTHTHTHTHTHRETTNLGKKGRDDMERTSEV